MRTKRLFILVAGALIGCATTSSTGSSTARQSDGDGLSCERRVKVAAIPEEYAWVKAHYPGAQVKMQTLGDCNGSPTDQLDITTSDGRDLTTFFDISSFF